MYKNWNFENNLCGHPVSSSCRKVVSLLSGHHHTPFTQKINLRSKRVCVGEREGPAGGKMYVYIFLSNIEYRYIVAREKRTRIKISADKKMYV